ncbi:uncharacterized protein LY89DRAFT_691392 [Mollisia scopiformis]|uniref:DUF7907 domain-containing protein n=1 Tax=Mollisia scopiformis TaxID=149040 RepID=A0A132B8X4_MOLSC|nr:uncharacterized protein LY89DRAFT_691392 [Mollisia scopiformis]KUJ08117.1 hypothetical protein LY89DRAFT_691392 [Mollisia scopiformis]
MVFIRNIALAATTLLGLTSAAPALSARQASVNNTQEFYIKLVVTDGPTTYQEWALEAYHTGAGLADPVFTNTTGSKAFLNGTNLQFDLNGYTLGASANAGDTNYARWEPVTIGSGYGTGGWLNNGSAGIVQDNEEFDGWLVCEWYHGLNAPQLFQWIKGFDAPTDVFPSSCSRVILLPEYI